MTKESAIRELPIYAETELPTPQVPIRHRIMSKQEFERRYGLLLLLAAAFTIYSVLLSAWVSHRTELRVRDEVAAEMRADFQGYLDQMAEDQRASQFLSGDASFEAAVVAFADQFDELIANYAIDYGLNRDGLYTIGWTYVARCAKASSEFGKTPEEIISKPGAWEGNVIGHAVRDQDTAIAQDIAREYLSGHYPDNWTPDMTFGNREAGGGFVARNQFITGPNTVYWRYQ